MDHIHLQNLVRELLSLPHETEWVEFKKNKAEPSEIGEYLSALSNSAALIGKHRAYILWGVEDGSREIVGTTFNPRKKKEGNQELESWLSNQLDPQIDLHIHEGEVDGKAIVLFEISPATNSPVSFRGTEYIRIGSCKQKLLHNKEKERELWRLFERSSFETGLAKNNVSPENVLQLIDYPSYFYLMKLPLPENRSAILEKLESENIIMRRDGGSYDITNAGALLFAKNLDDFMRLSRKSLRVILYKGDNRFETIKEHMSTRGYATCFQEMINYINDHLPQNEEIGQAFRREVRMYPALAVRELIANALIHQDFGIIGAGPMVEIFKTRIEITNPGIPLIDTLRFIDGAPKSRNEKLAKIMRRLDICEERGSGIDKVIIEIELFQLPAPDFRTTNHSTTAVLYAPRKFAQMDAQERLRACYQHASLLYVSGQRMSNGSLRKRLGIKDSNYPIASRIIRDAIAAKLIKSNPGITSRKDSTYMPFWG